jgi:hypothetical protein
MELIFVYTILENPSEICYVYEVQNVFITMNLRTPKSSGMFLFAFFHVSTQNTVVKTSNLAYLSLHVGNTQKTLYVAWGKFVMNDRWIYVHV